MPDLIDSMNVFVRTVDTGSFTAAANEMNMSASMVAKHVRFLEARVGARLLNRTTRTQSLTDTGRRYYERCRGVLAEVERADQCASEARNVPRGLLKIQAPVTFGAERLVPALAVYMRRYPEVDVELSLQDRRIDLAAQGCDAAIRIGPLGDARLVARPLRPYEMWLCASPAYLQARGAPADAMQLASHECLGFTSWRDRDFWRIGPDGRATDVPVKGRLVTNNGHALRAAALSGLGIIMQAEALVKSDVEAGRLVRLLVDHPLASRPMHVVYLSENRLSPKLRSFVEFAVEAFG